MTISITEVFASTGNDVEWVEITSDTSVNLTDVSLNIAGTSVSVGTLNLAAGQYTILFKFGTTPPSTTGTNVVFIAVAGWPNIPNNTDFTVTLSTPSETLDTEVIPAWNPSANGGQSYTVGVGYGTPTADVVCFLTGTHILTAAGEKPVETLKIGDRVRTVQGDLAPIKWIGIETITTADLHPRKAYPVQIKAGALGNQLPHRDLFVSPGHALFLDGILVDAGALVNDRSIVQTPPTAETFVYYHVELAQHSLIVAEGSATESYISQVYERAQFDNFEEFEALYPVRATTCRSP
jgi:hypothetical protein